MPLLMPLSHLKLLTPDDIKAGDLLLAKVQPNVDTVPLFVAMLEGKTVLVPLKDGFGLHGAGNPDRRYLCAGAPTFIVDHKSCFQPGEGDPPPGTLFLSSGAMGIVANYGGAAVYIGLDGSELPEPHWQDFVGFRSWQVTVEGRASQPVTIFESTSVV